MNASIIENGSNPAHISDKNDNIKNTIIEIIALTTWFSVKLEINIPQATYASDNSAKPIIATKLVENAGSPKHARIM